MIPILFLTSCFLLIAEILQLISVIRYVIQYKDKYAYAFIVIFSVAIILTSLCMLLLLKDMGLYNV